MINLENYKPIINTKDLSDHVIKLWFGGGEIGLIIVRKIEKVNNISKESYGGCINFSIDNLDLFFYCKNKGFMTTTNFLNKKQYIEFSNYKNNITMDEVAIKILEKLYQPKYFI